GGAVPRGAGKAHLRFWPSLLRGRPRLLRPAGARRPPCLRFLDRPVQHRLPARGGPLPVRKRAAVRPPRSLGRGANRGVPALFARAVQAAVLRPWRFAEPSKTLASPTSCS